MNYIKFNKIINNKDMKLMNSKNRIVLIVAGLFVMGPGFSLIVGCSKKNVSQTNTSPQSNVIIQNSDPSLSTLGPPSVGFLNYEGLPRKLMNALHFSLSDTFLTTAELTQLRQDLDNYKNRMCVAGDASSLDSTSCAFAKTQMEVRLCGVGIEKECSKSPDFRYYLKGICLPLGGGISATDVTNSNDPVLLAQKKPDAIRDYINRLSKEFHGEEADDAKKDKYLQLWKDTASGLATDPRFPVVASQSKGVDSRIKAASRMMCVAMAESLLFSTY